MDHSDRIVRLIYIGARGNRQRRKGAKKMPTFIIWHVGTRECSIEEASSEREACEKTGWKAEECEVQVIPEQYIVREFQAEAAPSA